MVLLARCPSNTLIYFFAHFILLYLRYSSGEKAPRVKGNFVLLSLNTKSGIFQCSGKRHRVDLVLICIPLRRSAYRQGFKLCPYTAKVFQSLCLDMVRRVPLPFLGYRPCLGSWRRMQSSHDEENHRYNRRLHAGASAIPFM